MKKMGIFFTDEPSLIEALKEAETVGRKLLGGKNTEPITIMLKDGLKMSALVTAYDGEHDPAEDMYYAELEV